MKPLLTTLLIFSTFTSFSQDITGTWSGELDLGLKKLLIVFHITKNTEGYQTTMDSPDQNAKGLPVNSTEYNHPKLRLKMATMGAEYIAEVSGDTVINGSFVQNGLSLNLKLTKKEFIRSRPQEPNPPFPYTASEVTFNSKKSGARLAGTLTYPLNGEKFPAVILVSGSGPQERNSEMNGHKLFLVMADYLTRKGIAVLRYDDRGVGKSTGDFKSATASDFTDDALAAVDYLRQQPKIDKTKIGIIGHSEGGTVAFMAAAQDPTIAHIVSMAGMATKGSDLLLKQNETILTLEGVPQEDVQSYCNILVKIYKMVEEHTDADLKANKLTIADTLFNSEPKLPESLRKNALMLIPALSTSPWLRHFLSNNPGDALCKITRTPILALYCGKDCQVDAHMNIAAIKNSSKNSRNSYKKYDNLNHMFQNCVTGKVNEYSEIEETISEQVLKDITEWVLNFPR